MQKNEKHEPEEEGVVLTPEQMALIAEGDASFERGEAYTAEQALEHARARVRAWLPPSQSA